MTVENQNLLVKNTEQKGAPVKLKLQEELKQWSDEKVDKKDGRPVEKIIKGWSQIEGPEKEKLLANLKKTGINLSK